MATLRARWSRLRSNGCAAAENFNLREAAKGYNAVPSSYEQLRVALKKVQPDSTKHVNEDVLALAWSVAHGAASLISDGVWKKSDPRADAALRLAIELMATRS